MPYLVQRHGLDNTLTRTAGKIMERPGFRLSMQPLIAAAVVIVSVAMAYASNRHKLAALEHRVTEQEELIEKLDDRIQKLERQVAVLQIAAARALLVKPDAFRSSRAGPQRP
jgi:uncharacterized coiled-coil protein SlyX